MAEPLAFENVSTKLKRIAELAKRGPTTAFRSLAHHIDVDWLREAYRRVRKDGAVGIDKQSAEEYAANLEENLKSLLERAKAGTYRAPPVLRVHIPKGDGSETRPIGIPTFEDKVLQRAVAMLMEAVYEQDFLECSYGFRPGRSAHQALEELQREAVWMAGGWILEVDIRKYFDTLKHDQLQTILRQRVVDGVLLRLIGKWLHAGVFENGSVSYPGLGSPQGGVISPLLANIYLHEVLDRWFEQTVKPRLKGKTRLIRYADDAVFLFAKEEDARRVLSVLAKRFAKYGLTLHPEKTRLVNFRRPDMKPPQGGVGHEPETFDLLGFTHYWGKSRRGKWIVKRRTAKGAFRRAIQRVDDWCKRHRHYDVRWQWQMLAKKLRGHYGYYGIRGNYVAIANFRYRLIRAWCKWLNRRSQRRTMVWDRMQRLLERFQLPWPRILNPYTLPLFRAAKP